MGSLLKKVSFNGFMLLIGLMMIIPFVFMISASLKAPADVFINPLNIIPDEIYTFNYETLFNHDYYFKWYWNSIRVVILTVVFRGAFVTMAAYAFARLEFKGKELLFLLLLSAMMIPQDTTIVARFLLYGIMGLNNTQWAIILPATFDVFFIFLLRQFFMGIPKDLSEAAIIDGASHFGIYFKIMIPLSIPVLITMTLFTFIWTWNDFVNPFIFISDIDKQLVTVGLEYFQLEAGQNYALQMAGSCLIVLIPMALFAFLQKYFIEGITMTGVKG
ncbi:sugar ABC transporter permease [Halolactibacillus alkaliphilus]|uniref:Sugar ABC transporter permease n=1 Tax=Halolactibacillus alkaliphilus TaxID=442899 RepID=A0A511X0J3_9BACI|nr:carbohydrate ABC transporter permease [Halolactibacillus alkaliphilus]GEN56467.1 sugar ABC transporter permease [Halolactibacillus alkaliphilus]GGN64299.1 sugar ABC transporter permease [Halolactibacillus alkaliphilus]SFO61406.1 multiple sugar transport system permease protein [Halolactibacillus alkaliphilus]